jgi:hypothetical protein
MSCSKSVGKVGSVVDGGGQRLEAGRFEVGGGGGLGTLEGRGERLEGWGLEV